MSSSIKNNAFYRVQNTATFYILYLDRNSQSNIVHIYKVVDTPNSLFRR